MSLQNSLTTKDGKELESIDILIIDDEPGIRSTLVELLEDEGFSCFSVPDGETALKALEVYPHFSLIICDIQMPKLNGLQFLSQMRATYQDRHTLLFLTGNGDKAKVIEALRLGAADFIDKPFKPSVLIPMVQRMVEVGLRQQQIWEERSNSPSVESAYKIKYLLQIVNSEEAKKVS